MCVAPSHALFKSTPVHVNFNVSDTMDRAQSKVHGKRKRKLPIPQHPWKQMGRRMNRLFNLIKTVIKPNLFENYKTTQSDEANLWCGLYRRLWGKYPPPPLSGPMLCPKRLLTVLTQWNVVRTNPFRLTKSVCLFRVSSRVVCLTQQGVICSQLHTKPFFCTISVRINVVLLYKEVMYPEVSGTKSLLSLDPVVLMVTVFAVANKHRTRCKNNIYSLCFICDVGFFSALDIAFESVVAGLFPERYRALTHLVFICAHCISLAWGNAFAVRIVLGLLASPVEDPGADLNIGFGEFYSSLLSYELPHSCLLSPQAKN